MSYVVGFLLPVPTKKLGAYKKLAQQAGKVWLEHGALEYLECIGDDLDSPMGLPFPKAMKLKKDETAVFAWVRYKSKKHHDQVNAKVMADERMQVAPKDMPFDPKRMSFGGFKVLVEKR